MAAITSTAGAVSSAASPMRRRWLPSASRTAGRLLAAIRDFSEGASWEPGRDWLTRVTDAGEPQDPR
jgi:hypothetical protein